MGAITIDVRKKMLTSSGWRTLDFSWRGTGGALTAIFGPSGAGKTTVLRMIAGLLTPDEGQIMVGDEVWFDSKKGIDIVPQRRSVGFVFQENSLFPNMTVRENILYALPQGNREGLIDELIGAADLKGLLERYPSQLSGGQQQRAALVRALMRHPRVLLLDEPLSSLDGAMRSGLQDCMMNIQRKTGVTTLMVSHELGEVFKMSDEVIVLKEGSIQASGDPRAVFAPYTVSGKFKFVAEVVDVLKDGFVTVFSLRIGNDIVRIVDMDIDAGSLSIGDRVVVASKAFNPVIIKCDMAAVKGGGN